jgi:hypothetical protein
VDEYHSRVFSADGNSAMIIVLGFQSPSNTSMRPACARNLPPAPERAKRVFGKRQILDQLFAILEGHVTKKDKQTYVSPDSPRKLMCLKVNGGCDLPSQSSRTSSAGEVSEGCGFANRSDGRTSQRIGSPCEKDVTVQAGSVGTIRTPSGKAPLPSRGITASPRPAPINASWVACSAAVLTIRGSCPSDRIECFSRSRQSSSGWLLRSGSVQGG